MKFKIAKGCSIEVIFNRSHGASEVVHYKKGGIIDAVVIAQSADYFDLKLSNGHYMLGVLKSLFKKVADKRKKEMIEVHFAIDINGKTEDDILEALRQVMSKLENGYLSGHDSNDDGGYWFNDDGGYWFERQNKE